MPHKWNPRIGEVSFIYFSPLSFRLPIFWELNTMHTYVCNSNWTLFWLLHKEQRVGYAAVWFVKLLFERIHASRSTFLHCYLFGNEFRNKSLVFVFNFSGKTISKEISMSPLLKGSLDSGKPFPAIRLTVVGLTTSSNRFTTNRSPFNVGTSTLVPHNAWKTKEINVVTWVVTN